MPIITRRRALRLLAAPAILKFGCDWSRGFVGYDEILQIGDSNSYAGLNVDGTPCYNPSIDTINSLCCEWRSDNRNPYGAGAAYFFTIIADWFHPFDYAPPGQAVVASAVNGVGPGESFIQEWQTNFVTPGRKTRITTLGIGGTGLCNTSDPTTGPTAWQATPVVGGTLTTAIQKINLALAQSSMNRMACILWTSGANDAIWEHSFGLSTATYQTAFEALASYLRTNIVGTGASTVPILIQPLVPAFVTNPPTAAPNTNAALSTMPSVVSQCGYADPSAPGLSGNIIGQTAVAYHLTGPSQRLIGSIGFVNAYNGRSA
jgi:hypothetical protein